MSLDDRPLLEARLAADERAPYLARLIVASVVTDAPAVRGYDTSLLTSEIVSLRVADASVVDLCLREVGRSLRVEVSSDGPAPDADELVSGLLDRLADRSAPDGAWFEVELVRRRMLDTLAIEDLFGLLPDHDARSELFDRYVGFAASLARKFRRPTLGLDDLEQVAAIALVKAIDRFDTGHGAKFTTYAAKTINGELKRHLRDSSWSMRVPRGLKEDSIRVRKAQAELTQALGRDPTAEEVAKATDLGADQVYEAIEAGQAYSASSLDAPIGEDGVSLANVLGKPDAAIERAEAWQTVEAAMTDLPERERLILYLRFFEDLSQSEIAAVVGVSQMHVSRLIARSLEEIKEAVGASE